MQLRSTRLVDVGNRGKTPTLCVSCKRHSSLPGDCSANTISFLPQCLANVNGPGRIAEPPKISSARLPLASGGCEAFCDREALVVGEARTWSGLACVNVRTRHRVASSSDAGDPSGERPTIKHQGAGCIRVVQCAAVMRCSRSRALVEGASYPAHQVYGPTTPRRAGSE